MSDIFLSYCRDDISTARRFAEGFEREGFTVWWDQSLEAGEAFDHVTEKALEAAQAVVVLWSKHSVESRWVRAEATQAEREKKLVPVTIGPCKRPIMFELTQTADLSHWNGDTQDRSWLALVAGLRKHAGKVRPATAPVPIAATESAAPLRKITGIAIGIGVLLIAGLIAFLLLRSPGRRDAPPAVASTTIAAPVTLAVLPFANLSSDPEQEYFSDGLTEEILNQLAQVDALSVTARTSSFSFKGRNEDVRVIAQKLGVANLLEGSIRKEGNQLRITAQLVGGKDGAHLWSKTYDRQLSGVFALQEEIAKDVASALSIKLDVGENRRAKGGTTNLEAWDKYLQAAALLGKGFNKDSAAQAVEMSREAVALDPAFVRGWDQLAYALRFMQVWTPERAAALRGQAAQAEAHIVSLAPESGQAKRIRLAQLLEQRKWTEAAALVKSAAGEAEVQTSAIGFLSDTGRFEEVLPLVQRACTRDPLSLACSATLQGVAAAAGHPAEAQAEYVRSKGLAGAHIESDAIAMVRYGVGPNPDPKILLPQFMAIMRDKNRPVALDSKLLDTVRNLDDAGALLGKAQDNPANQEGLRIAIIAFWAGGLGDRDLALAALRQAVVDLHAHTSAFWLVSYSRGWRSDPRFKNMLRDVGLADYFRASGNWGDFCKPVGTEDFECH
jgi:TolB-like protein